MIEQASIIIPIAGKARAGKDSAAKILKEKLEDDGYRVLILHFADYLKFGCATYYEWDGNKDNFGRELLQHVGTNEIRKLYPDFWVDCVCKWINGSLKNDYDIFIIPDTRFENEITYFQKFPFETATIVVPTRVIREGYTSVLTQEQQQHISETALDNYDFEYDIVSEGGLDKLAVAVDFFYDYLKGWYLC